MRNWRRPRGLHVDRRAYIIPAMSRPLLWILAIVAVILVAFFFGLSPFVAARMNVVNAAQAIPVSPGAAALHATLRIVDLHDDLLLWDRDVLGPSSHGHTDVARMVAGNIALQVFSTVTKTPRGQNYTRNDSTTDNITLLAIASRWPPRTWGSRLQRALVQARKLERAEAASGGRLVIARTRAGLASALEARASAPGAKPVIGILNTEGLQAIDGKAGNVDTLFAHGFRMAGLTHFFDNEVAGSAHGTNRGGLTALGREAITRMESLKMIVDLAHASPAAFDEVIAMATRPMAVSHGGVRATCPDRATSATSSSAHSLQGAGSSASDSGTARSAPPHRATSRRRSATPSTWRESTTSRSAPTGMEERPLRLARTAWSRSRRRSSMPGSARWRFVP